MMQDKQGSCSKYDEGDKMVGEQEFRKSTIEWRNGVLTH